MRTLPGCHNGEVGKKLISEADGKAALADLETQMPTAVRYLLQQISVAHPGGTVELRVPPFGAVQCLEGLNHRRGTPPNVVELSPDVFLKLCLGQLQVAEASKLPGCNFSGEKALSISEVFPLTNY